MPTHAPESNLVPSAPPSTLDELLACHDQHFVQSAYQLLLGRAPDPEGLGYSLGRLRTGFTKIRILAQLRQSKEGKAHGATLPGLDKALQRHRQEQYPLIGWVYKQRHGAESNHPTERKLRAIENQVYLLGEQSNHRFNQLEIALSGLQRLVVQQSQSVVTALGGGIDASTQLDKVKAHEPEELKKITPRARDIYFQLKSAVAMHAGRTA